MTVQQELGRSLFGRIRVYHRYPMDNLGGQEYRRVGLFSEPPYPIAQYYRNGPYGGWCVGDVRFWAPRLHTYFDTELEAQQYLDKIFGIRRK